MWGRGKELLLRDQERMESRDFGGENVLAFLGEVPKELADGWDGALIWI